MGVYCGVCGERLDSANENYGSFYATAAFEGWHQEPGKTVIVSDTCRDCHNVLAAAVTEAANKIVRRHKDVHDRLRAELHAQREQEAQFKRDEAAFRANWRPKT